MKDVGPENRFERGKSEKKEKAEHAREEIYKTVKLKLSRVLRAKGT